MAMVIEQQKMPERLIPFGRQALMAPTHKKEREQLEDEAIVAYLLVNWMMKINEEFEILNPSAESSLPANASPPPLAIK